MAEVNLRNQKAEIQSKLSRAQTFSRDWHSNIKKWRELYNGEHYKGQAKKVDTEPQYNDPTYQNTIDLTIGILLANEMVWKAYGASPSDDEMKRASKAEKFLSAVLSANDARNEYSIVYEVYNHFARDGGACLYTIWSPSIHKQMRETVEMEGEDGTFKPTTVISEPPIVVRVVDPLAMDILPGGPGRWQAMCENTERFLIDVETEYADDIMELYGKARLPSFEHLNEDQRAIQTGTFKNYWDISVTGGKTVVRCAVLFDGDIVRPLREMKGYDALPYTVNFWKPVDRNKSGAWQSSISPLEGTVPWVEKNINRLQHQIDVFSSMPWLSKTNGRKVTTDPGMGQVVDLMPGEDFGFPQWPGSPPDLWRILEWLRGRLQQSGFSDVMFGGGPSSVSGYALSQLGDQNRIRLEQPIEHLTLFWTWWARKVLDMTKKFAKSTPICMYGTSRGSYFHEYVSGKDFDGLHVEVQIKPEFPNERVRKHAMATQVKGILPDSVIVEDYLGYPQPDDIRERKLQENAQSHPVMQMYLMFAELARRAEQNDVPAAMTVAYLMQSGQVPGLGAGGRPPEPNAPEQPMGLQSPTGQPLNQQRGDATMGINQEMSNQQNAAPNMQGGI